MSDVRKALLPCPFCGGEAREIDAVVACVVACRDCDAMQDRDTREEVQSAWNRRAALSALPEDRSVGTLERLREKSKSVRRRVPVSAEHHYCDWRTAYDALDQSIRDRLDAAARERGTGPALGFDVVLDPDMDQMTMKLTNGTPEGTVTLKLKDDAASRETCGGRGYFDGEAVSENIDRVKICPGCPDCTDTEEA